VRYQKEHEILGMDEKQNIIMAKLDELNKELTVAESERMDKEAMTRMVESGDPDVIASSTEESTLAQVGSLLRCCSRLYAPNRRTSRSRQPI